jgi:hypothetical protein
VQERFGWKLLLLVSALLSGRHEHMSLQCGSTALTSHVLLLLLLLLCVSRASVLLTFMTSFTPSLVSSASGTQLLNQPGWVGGWVGSRRGRGGVTTS